MQGPHTGPPDPPEGPLHCKCGPVALGRQQQALPARGPLVCAKQRSEQGGFGALALQVPLHCKCPCIASAGELRYPRPAWACGLLAPTIHTSPLFFLKKKDKPSCFAQERIFFFLKKKLEGGLAPSLLRLAYPWTSFFCF